MIGKNWMKALAVAGAGAVVAAVMPAISEAHSYTGKTPAGIAMMAAPEVIVPVQKTVVKKATVKVLTKRVHHPLKHKKLAAVSAKHAHHKAVTTGHVKKKTV